MTPACDEEKPTKICDLRMENLEKLFDARIRHIEVSTKLAADGLRERLATMNEIRGQLDDQAETFLTRAEYTQGHGRLVEDVRDLRESRAALAGKAEQSSVNIAMLLAIIGVLASIVSIILTFIHYGK